MKPLKMVDLELEQRFFGPAIEKGIGEVLRHTQFIRGPEVMQFAEALSAYLSFPGEKVHVIPCANGTDALQLALMALGIGPGDEVIVPAFTYVATAEVARLLGVGVRWVDVSLSHFNLLPEALEAAYTPRVKAIVPVHLFGQAAPMEPILEFARQRGLYVIEDVAQALGASYYTPQGPRKLGTLGDIGCTSFFPSKNLGCYGDGGAVFTRDAKLAEKIARIANHGQSTLYEFVDIGVNSRLDSLQAAILWLSYPIWMSSMLGAGPLPTTMMLVCGIFLSLSFPSGSAGVIIFFTNIRFGCCRGAEMLCGRTSKRLRFPP
jgi:UDP-2-acetamido-2-deoxy-ribo-hexuluronate aminotransferase